MDELKTMKDLFENYDSDNLSGDYVEGRGDVFDESKQEAIKHIKELTKKRDEIAKDGSFNWSAIQETINWIKHFFNINEEDLK